MFQTRSKWFKFTLLEADFYTEYKCINPAKFFLKIIYYTGQEATVRTGHGKMDQFQTGKGIWQGYILSPCLFNLYTEYTSWMKHKL